MKNKNFVSRNTNATIDSIKSFKEQPLNSLGQILPVGMVSTSLIGFLVAIIKFVLNGGFSKQISEIDRDFVNGISKGFTYGTSEILTSGIVSKTISIMLIVELFVLVVSYLKTETKAKKVIVCTCFVIDIILFGMVDLILLIGFGKINLSKETEMKILDFLSIFEGVKKATVLNGLKIIVAMGIVAFILFIVLMFLSKHRWMIKNSAVALLISYVIIPLVLLLIENIIPMILGIVVVVIYGGILLVMGKGLASGTGEISDGTSKHQSRSVSPKISYSHNKSKEKAQPKKEFQQKKEFNLNSAFWRDEGGNGIMIPTGDCIYVINGWGEKTYVCTVHDYEKGKVAIINKKVRVMNIAGCKTPIR